MTQGRKRGTEQSDSPETGTLEDIYNFPPDEPNKASGLIEHFSEYDLIGG